jgi:hypothetical protein
VGQALRELDGDVGQRGGMKGEGPGEGGVLLGAANTHGRGQNRVEPAGDLPRDGVREHRVRADRQVPALVLDRAERHHHRRDAVRHEPRQLGGGERLELIHARHCPPALSGARIGQTPAVARRRSW